MTKAQNSSVPLPVFTCAGGFHLRFNRWETAEIDDRQPRNPCVFGMIQKTDLKGSATRCIEDSRQKEKIPAPIAYLKSRTKVRES